MTDRPSALAAYPALVRVQFAAVLVHRADYAVNLIGVVLRIYLYTLVWKAVYAGRNAVDGIEVAVIVEFATLAVIQQWLIRPPTLSLIPRRIHVGTIAGDLVRPQHFLGQMAALQVGQTAARGVLVLAVIPVAVLIGEVGPPPTPEAALAAGPSFVLAYLISLVLSLLLGVTAAWTTEINGAFMVYRMIEQFLSGALVPLWFMPDVVRSVAAVLPFQAVVFTPLAVYLGERSGSALVGALAVQVGWLLGLSVAVAVVWRTALRRIVIHGG